MLTGMTVKMDITSHSYAYSRLHVDSLTTEGQKYARRKVDAEEGVAEVP